jgi:hypothetical protein
MTNDDDDETFCIICGIQYEEQLPLGKWPPICTDCMKREETSTAHAEAIAGLRARGQ